MPLMILVISQQVLCRYLYYHIDNIIIPHIMESKNLKRQMWIQLMYYTALVMLATAVLLLVAMYV